MAENPSEDAQARLTVMEKESNGFRIAEEDLNLRGPGELTGTRQSGLPPLKNVRLETPGLSIFKVIHQKHRQVVEDMIELEALDHLGDPVGDVVLCNLE